MPAQTPREKFQDLLRELFQIEDAAELDFGIYRIMGQKRGVIEKFIDQELLAIIDAELATGALKQEAANAAQLAELAAQIREDIAEDAIDPEGVLAPEYQPDKVTGKLPKKLTAAYLALQAQSNGAVAGDAREASIYNHLYQFFRRYYDKGDFMSLRRYSKRQKYAIPYNGEEVHLHWANADQYYIKTGEDLTDYRWKDQTGKVRVRFTVTKADVPKDNIKAPEKRFFLPQIDAATCEEIGTGKDKHTLVTLPFHFRGLTADETERLTEYATEKKLKGGGTGKLQSAALGGALDALPKAAFLKGKKDALAALIGERRKDADGAPVSHLAHHLRRFTVKNTSDYFIHKDLGGFLARELDFYIKNEVLHLDSLDAGGEERAEGWFQMMRLIRRIGAKIIAFLAQIENFQKRLFEKKKFVTECHYCMTLDRVPEELYPEIAKNKAQIEEWKQLFAIHEAEGWTEPPTVEFLKANWNLVVETRFHPDSRDRLLDASPTTGNETSATLVRGESYQALSLLDESFSERVKCIYSDPPYNTGKDEFIYKDSYKHSSWLSLIHDRVRLSTKFLRKDGVAFCSIDDVERARLQFVLEAIFGPNNKVASMVWKGATDNNPTRVAVEHEYILCWAKDAKEGDSEWKNRADSTKEIMLNEYRRLCKDLNDAKTIQTAYRRWIKDNKESLQPLTHYDRIDADGPYTGSRKVHNPGKEGYRYDVIHPTTKKPCNQPARGYRYPESRMLELLDADKILFGKDHTQIIQIKEYLEDFRGSLKGVIELDSRTATNALEALFGSREVFKNPKPTTLLELIFPFVTSDDDVVMDFLAGSGTTGQAVLSCNRDDGASRGFVLVEMGAHFDTVLLPRLLKAAYSGRWDSGKPSCRKSGVSACFQYAYLESYADALGNIAFDDKEAAQRQLNFDEYVLNYMLAFETGGSETLLDVEKLSAPFDYKLEIRDGDETVFKKVDLPETFNFLLGLRVRTRRVLHRKMGKAELKYLVLRGKTNPHATGGEREVAVIWRTTEKWQTADFEADRDFVREHQLAEGADEVFVNSDSVIPGAQSLDPIFKRRMFNEPD